MKFRNPPPFPTGEPAFVQELRREEEIPVCWETAAQPEAGEADFRRGLRLLPEFPDPEQLLLTAEREMHRFLQRNNLAKPDGAPLITRRAADLAGETFRMTVTADAVTLEAGNTEGIRRGLYTILDSLAGSRGPFLPLGCSTRRPWLKNRISRCFFSPIKRPPFQRDELLDEVDYYPEAYLARLAREGVNGLWLSISFREVCTTSFYAVDPQAQQRLGKLRRTVETCRKYGIRIWVFGIEPAGWEEEKNPCPSDAPELQGPKFGCCTSFCPASETAQRYLYECTRSLFSAVPELGGLITISLGERVTSCLSTLSVTTEKTHPCGAACSRSPSEILACVLRPMTEGMHAAAPNAELISWLYLPAEDQAAEWIYQLPEALPHNVILAFNFESGCTARQLGKLRVGGDYWLSRTGPSDRFGRMVQAVRSHCSPGAKIQACCSHEVASVPFVPVPGQLYRKYRAMRQLGVEHVIQCWFFGNYPGLMNRAAGKLAFEEFTGSEESFLEELAAPEWGRRNAPVMATVWRLFTGYPVSVLWPDARRSGLAAAPQTGDALLAPLVETGRGTGWRFHRRSNHTAYAPGSGGACPAACRRLATGSGSAEKNPVGIGGASGSPPGYFPHEGPGTALLFRREHSGILPAAIPPAGGSAGRAGASAETGGDCPCRNRSQQQIGGTLQRRSPARLPLRSGDLQILSGETPLESGVAETGARNRFLRLSPEDGGGNPPFTNPDQTAVAPPHRTLVSKRPLPLAGGRG